MDKLSKTAEELLNDLFNSIYFLEVTRKYYPMNSKEILPFSVDEYYRIYVTGYSDNEVSRKVTEVISKLNQLDLEWVFKAEDNYDIVEFFITHKQED